MPAFTHRERLQKGMNAVPGFEKTQGKFYDQ